MVVNPNDSRSSQILNKYQHERSTAQCVITYQMATITGRCQTQRLGLQGDSAIAQSTDWQNGQQSDIGTSTGRLYQHDCKNVSIEVRIHIGVYICNFNVGRPKAVRLWKARDVDPIDRQIGFPTVSKFILLCTSTHVISLICLEGYL